MSVNSEWNYWNSQGSDKIFTIPFNFGEFEKLVDKESTVFDFGCGYGRILEELKFLDYKYLYGCDYSFPMLKKAKNGNIHVIQNDNIKIPFKNSCFDAVIIIAVLTCIVNSELQKKLIEEIYRVMKPGASIFVADFLLNDDPRNLERYSLFNKKYNEYGIFEIEPDIPLRHHSQDYIRSILGGFQFHSFSIDVYNTMNGNASKGFYLTATK